MPTCSPVAALLARPLALLAGPLALLVGLAACAPTPPAVPPGSALPTLAAQPPVGASAASSAGAVAGRLYVPVYSGVYFGDSAALFQVTVTLSVRNPNEHAALTLDGIRYFDPAGRMIHAYLSAPEPLAPMASREIIVKESDSRAGGGGSFLVDWSATQPLSEPVVESVMIGTRSNQGISLVSQGRVVSRTGPAVGAAGGATAVGQ